MGSTRGSLLVTRYIAKVYADQRRVLPYAAMLSPLPRGFVNERSCRSVVLDGVSSIEVLEVEPASSPPLGRRAR